MATTPPSRFIATQMVVIRFYNVGPNGRHSAIKLTEFNRYSVWRYESTATFSVKYVLIAEFNSVPSRLPTSVVFSRIIRRPYSVVAKSYDAACRDMCNRGYQKCREHIRSGQ